MADCPLNTVNEQAKAWGDVPGPRRLPFFGNVFQMDKEYLHLWLKEQAARYGPILRLKFFGSEAVFLNTIEGVKEALLTRGTDCMASKETPRAQDLAGPDVSLSYPILRECVYEGMQHIVSLEEHHTIHKLICEDIGEKYGGLDSVNVRSMVNCYVTRALSLFVLGGNNQFEDEKAQAVFQIDKTFNELVVYDSGSTILDLKPCLYNHKWFKSSYHRRHRAEKERISNLCQRQISLVREAMDANEPKCVMEHLLMRQATGVEGKDHSHLNDSNLGGLLQDLSFGTYGASTNQINEMINLLLKNQPLQERLQREIDSNFPQNYFIKSSDRVKLPQMEAFMWETLRYCPPLPMLIPHCTERDTVIGGYQVPAGTWVWINYYNISRNEEIYPEPDTFNIDRLLDADGKVLPEDHPVRANIIPFGIGARYCPGTQWSMESFFVMMSHLLQNYTLELIGDAPETDPRLIKCDLSPLNLRFIESSCRLNKRVK